MQAMLKPTCEAGAERDLNPDKANLITRVWGDGTQEDYTCRIVHAGIDRYFDEGEPAI